MSDATEDYGLEERLVRSLGWAIQFVKPRTDAEHAMLTAARRNWQEGIAAFIPPYEPPTPKGTIDP